MLDRRWTSALLAVGLMLPGSGAFASDPDHHGHGPGPRLEKHLEELGLEPAKLAAVRAILAESKAGRDEHRERMRSAFQEMHALLDQDAPDEDAVMRQAELLGELRTEGHKAMLHALLAVRAELTPEQRAQLREKMQADRAERPWWHRRHGGSDEP